MYEYFSEKWEGNMKVLFAKLARAGAKSDSDSIGTSLTNSLTDSEKEKLEKHKNLLFLIRLI